MEKVPDIFRCPICMEIFQKEIFQCQSGHAICTGCAQNLESCPQCRVSFENPKIRNRTLEEVLNLNDLKIQCPYKSDGCDVTPKVKEFTKHSLLCPYNPQCLTFCNDLGYTTCKFVTNPSKISPLLQHLVAKHKIIEYHGEAYAAAIILHNFQDVVTSNKMNTMWTPILLKKTVPTATGVGTGNASSVFVEPSPNFLLCFAHNAKDETVSLFCVFLGISNNAEYQAEFQIKRESRQVDNLEWSVPCVSMMRSKIALQFHPYRIPTSLLLEHYTHSSNGSVKVTVSMKQRLNDSSNTNHDLDQLPQILTFNAVLPDPTNSAEVPSTSTSINPATENGNNNNAVFLQLLASSRALSVSNPSLPLSTTKNVCTGCRAKLTLKKSFYCCLQCADFYHCETCFTEKPHSQQHTFCKIKNKEQENLIKRTQLFLKGYQPIFPHDCGVSMLMNAHLKDPKTFFYCTGTPKHKEPHVKCGKKMVMYVCLQCQNYQLCKSCMHGDHALGHNAGHIMAVVNEKDEKQLQFYFLKRQLYNRFPVFIP